MKSSRLWPKFTHGLNNYKIIRFKIIFLHQKGGIMLEKFKNCTYSLKDLFEH